MSGSHLNGPGESPARAPESKREMITSLVAAFLTAVVALALLDLARWALFAEPAAWGSRVFMVMAGSLVVVVAGYFMLRQRQAHQRRWEEVFRQSEERYRQLVALSPDAIVVHCEGKIVYVNDAGLRLFRASGLEMALGRPVIEFVHPDYRDLVHARIGRIYADGQPVEVVREKMIRLDGEVFDADVAAALVPYEGKPAVQVVVRDVTERQRMEEALQRSEERYRRLLESVTDYTYLIEIQDGRAVATWHSPTCTAVTGYTPEEYVADPYLWHRMVYDEDKPAVSEHAARLLAGIASPIEHRIVRKDGSIRWVRNTPVLRYNDQGQLVACDGSVSDITARKRAEEALAVRVEQLTALVRASQAVTASLDIKQVLAEIVSLASSVTGSDYTAVVLMDEAGNIAQTAENLPGAPALKYRIRPAGFTQWIVRSQQSVIVDEIRADGVAVQEGGERLPLPVNPFLVEMGIKSLAGIPLMVKGRLLGVLYLHSLRPGAFRERQPLIAALANQVAIALENSRLYAEQQRRVEEAAALLEIAHAVSSSLRLDDILKEVALRAARMCRADRCTLFLLDESGEMLRPFMSQFASGRQDAGMWKLFREHSPWRVEDIEEAVQIVRERRPLHIASADFSPALRRWTAPFGVENVLAVPLVSRERVVGLMALDYSGDEQAVAQGRIDLAVTIASQAAVAIENARLHQELQEYAHQLELRVRERTEQFQAQYARMEAILRSSADGIIVADAQGEVLQANPVAQQYLAQTLSPQDAGRLRDAVRDLAGRAAERPETILELTGLDLELRAAPISGPGSGEEQAAVVTIHDVSHIKALDRVKSRFVSNVSHELRTPVTTIKLYANLLQRPLPKKKSQEYLELLAQEADRQARLVEDILRISRIDSGRMELHPRPVSLNELVQAALVNHRGLADQQGVILESDTAEPEVMALADPVQITLVLSNLIVNAIRYTLEQGGRVTVSTGRLEAEGRAWAVVMVRDTGIGIPAEELPHIFERFYRGERPREMQVSGTGLGLAIVKEIVELHGGRVTAESEIGKGSVFTVWLPWAEREAAGGDERTTGEPGSP